VFLAAISTAMAVPAAAGPAQEQEAMAANAILREQSTAALPSLIIAETGVFNMEPDVVVAGLVKGRRVVVWLRTPGVIQFIKGIVAISIWQGAVIVKVILREGEGMVHVLRIEQSVNIVHLKVAMVALDSLREESMNKLVVNN